MCKKRNKQKKKQSINYQSINQSIKLNQSIFIPPKIKKTYLKLHSLLEVNIQYIRERLKIISKNKPI